jgi:hypothetical protein
MFNRKFSNIMLGFSKYVSVSLDIGLERNQNLIHSPEVYIL